MEDTISEPVKITVTCLAVLISVFDGIAANAIARSRRTPANCRFMSLGLIFLDWLFMVCVLCRVWNTKDKLVKLYSERACYTIGSLAYNTIALMSLDRYLLFTHAQFYAEYLHKRNGRRIVIIFWICQVVVFVGCRLMPCTWMYGETHANGTCYIRTGQVFAACTAITIIIATGCCVRIFLLIRQKQRYFRTNLTVCGHITSQNAKDTKQLTSSSKLAKLRNDERSSYLVFSYMLTILCGIIGFLAYLIRSEIGHGHDFFRGALVFSILSCIVDPCVYVFWFRECRMQLLNMCVCCIPRLRTKVTRMRIEIFDIVTASRCTGTSIPQSPT